MGKLTLNNLRKTIYYLQKNGFKNTILAAAERLQKKEQDDYTYQAPSRQVLGGQREHIWKNPILFSIVVPVYHTPEKYFCEMVESVLCQTYPYFELILADAGKERHLEVLAKQYQDSRIRYIKLEKNAGIAENTNEGLKAAKGEYIVLLDHDDLLTEDALYEIAAARETALKAGADPVLLYSDEDKCSGDAAYFYDPHFKKDYDQDLLLTNNYFCHLTAVKGETAKEIGFRKAYDGAQDFDFVLRITAETAKENIIHVPKILYHWRCHIDSTAGNPKSKGYAYEAGKAAVEDYVNRKGWKAEVTHLKHLGFYRINYQQDIFVSRKEVGAVGGRILNRKKKIAGGMMNMDGKVIYEGLLDGFSGYVNRAALVQQAPVLDIRCMRLNPACVQIFEAITGLPVITKTDGRVDWEQLPEGTDYVNLSRALSQALQKAGYILLWDPELVEYMK